jgi:gamma-glutamyltranspeptidase/glutathione hydrolase
MRNFETPGRSLAVSENGMAATSHPSATLTAVEMLKAGGNAIDAAIAAVAVQCAVEAGSTGIGGDCFAMVALEGSRDIRAYNGSGCAPSTLTAEALRSRGMTSIPPSSPHAVTIPGAVDAWCRLLADFGRMSLKDVLQPAIDIARRGYALTPRVALDLNGQAAMLASSPAASATFLIHGAAPSMGTVQRQPLLAETLAAIAETGRDAFYRGEIARDMIDYLRGLGGFHSESDFETVAGEYVKPISTRYRDHEIYECPPNGQGIVALLILNILSRLPVAVDPFDVDGLHRLVEATRLAYAARDAMLGDPASSSAADRMLSKEFAAELAAQISVDRVIEPLPPFGLPEHKDTVYLCVVDRDRTAVSFINSLFASYGSGLMSPKSGVLFHNRGQSFSLLEGHPNELGPRRRPMHTIIPGMVVKDGRVVMPFGVMGGHYQAMGHAHFLSRLFDCGLDVQTAIDMPRLFPLPGSKTVEAEELLRRDLGPQLERRGFEIQAPRGPIGGAQAIWIDWERGLLIGGSDHRKDGFALGS